jgi:hypothetical protein
VLEMGFFEESKGAMLPKPVTGVTAHLGITVDVTAVQTYIDAQGVV